MSLVTDRFAECLKTLYLNEYPCHDRPINVTNKCSLETLD